MAGIIERGIQTLIANELVTFLVFALVMAVVFGVLQNIKIFGSDRENETKKYNLVISIVFGLLSVLPHYLWPGSQYDIIETLTKALPQTVLILIAVLGVLILLGLLGLDKILEDSNLGWLKIAAALILLVAVIWIFVGATGTVWRLPHWLSPDMIAAIVALVVFGLVVSFIMKDDTGKKKRKDSDADPDES
jgi:hypothetical protein